MISRWTVGVEIQKLRVQLLQTYTTKLVEMRVGTYPELYSYMSDLAKLTIRRVPSRTELEVLQGKVDFWDSKYAIFLGRDTVNVCYDFRMALNDAIAVAAEEPSTRDSISPDWLSQVLAQAEALELGLRSDLGLYGLETNGSPQDFVPRVVKNY
jgi:hypothetical protein